jgi:hypothetical protein
MRLITLALLCPLILGASACLPREPQSIVEYNGSIL